MQIWDCRSGCVVQTLPPATHFPLDCDVTPSGLILLSMTGFDSGFILFSINIYRKMVVQLNYLTGGA